MADTQRSERCDRKVVGVQISPWAPKHQSKTTMQKFEYEKGSIEHRLQPPGGRSLETYERQLMFSRYELEGKKVLDLGAGPEVKFEKEIKQSGIKAEVVSLSPDFSEEKYSQTARRSLPKGKLIAGVGQALPFADESFDRIFAFHVDEHISPQAFPHLISEMARVLKKEGEAKLGPTLNIPGEWDSYQAITSNEQLMNYLRKNNVEVVKEPIPETIMPKTAVKNSFGDRFYETSYNIVLKKRTLISTSS